MTRKTKEKILCTPEDAPVGDAPFTDGAPVTAMDMSDTFPYLNTPIAGDAGTGN